MSVLQACARRVLHVREYDDESKRLGEMPSLEEMYKTGLKLAGPATVEGVLTSLIGSVDTMMVGTLGPASIAAVGLTNQPRLIMLILIQSLCIGTTAVIARRRGQRNEDGISRCFRQSMLLAVLIGVFLTFLGNLLCEPIMKIAGANEETLAESCAYFRIINSGILFNCITLTVCAALRGIGLTRITMTVNVTANLVNVVFNFLLIGGHFGFPALGVRGAAIATVIGNGVGACIALAVTLRKNSPMPLKLFSKWRFDKETLRAVSGISFSSIGENVCFRLGFLINSRIVANLGTLAFAAYQIVTNVTTLSFTLGDGLSVAGATLIGQNLGRERPDIANVYFKVLRRMAIFLSLGLMIVVTFLRYPIISLFTDDPVVVRYCSISMLIAVVGMIPQNDRVVYSGCLRGAGDVGFVALTALISVTILRPTLSYVFSFPLGMEVAGSWIAFVIDALVRDAAYTLRIRSGKWAKIKV